MSRTTSTAPPVPSAPIRVPAANQEAGARPLRADARRNRDALLAAAARLFTDRGVDVPLEEIAREAGVGIGTLYRHYPTRDAVIEAVYRREVETLCTGIDERLAVDRPDHALETWMGDLAAYVARKRGMAMALRAVVGADSTLFAESRDRIIGALTQLLNASVAAGTIRADVDPDDLMRAVGGICMATDTPGWQDRTGRLVALLMDGLRYGAAGGSGGSTA